MDEAVAAIDIGASEGADAACFGPFDRGAYLVDRAHSRPLPCQASPLINGLHRADLKGRSSVCRGNNHRKRRLSRESWSMELQPISFIPRTISVCIRPSAATPRRPGRPLPSG